MLSLLPTSYTPLRGLIVSAAEPQAMDDDRVTGKAIRARVGLTHEVLRSFEIRDGLHWCILFELPPGGASHVYHVRSLQTGKLQARSLEFKRVEHCIAKTCARTQSSWVSGKTCRTKGGVQEAVGRCLADWK